MMGTSNRNFGFLSPFKITLIYLIVASLWITFTDQILEAWVSNIEALSQFQTYKGLFYIIITSLGLYFLIKKHESQIRKTLEEKETLLQEIHHRVKNNLAVVSGLLQMQRFNSNSIAVKKTLFNSEMRIKSMALIHEKLYKTQSLSEIDLKYYLEDLISSIDQAVNSSTNISFQLDCDSVKLNVNQAIPCALIINELITNSIQHAFKVQKEGCITIELTSRDDTVNIKVHDDGRGLPKDFDKEDSQSMGFSIINTLVDQLEAQFEINSNNGTRASFSFRKQFVKGSSSTLI